MYEIVVADNKVAFISTSLFLMLSFGLGLSKALEITGKQQKNIITIEEKKSCLILSVFFNLFFIPNYSCNYWMLHSIMIKIISDFNIGIL